MSAIEKHSDEFSTFLSDYQLVAAMCNGERAVKRLPDVIVNPYDENEETEVMKRRFNKYLSLACFFSITETTVEQLTGMALASPPELDYDESVKSIVDDANGSNASMIDMFGASLNEVVKFGRDGLLVDYPELDNKISLEEKNAIGAKAKVIRFGAESIFNVRDEGGKVVEIRLTDRYQELSEDGVNYQTKSQVLLLRLVNGVYMRSTWRDGDMTGSEKVITDYNGNPFNHIPFYFIGSVNNSHGHDKIPMLRIANLDKKILQNSADSELNAHMTSGATFVMGIDSSIDTETFSSLNGKVNLGVTSSLNVGENGHGAYQQAQESDSSRKLLLDKLEVARQIGAKLIVNTSVQNTKTGAKNELVEGTSALKTIVSNVAKAYNSAFKDVFMFETGREGVFNIEPSYDFSKETLDSAVVALYPELVDSRIVLPIEARIKLRELGVIPEKVNGEELSDEDALEKMKEMSPIPA